MITLVNHITDAELPLSLVEHKVLEELKAQRPRYVNAMEFAASKRLIVSENYSSCQGVVFQDEKFRKGAHAHNHHSSDPYYFLTGRSKHIDTAISDPAKIFQDLKKVFAVHIYHTDFNEWSTECINTALTGIGMTGEKIVHIPIKSKIEGIVEYLSIAHDVQNGKVYVFPEDFDKGICFDLKEYITAKKHSHNNILP